MKRKLSSGIDLFQASLIPWPCIRCSEYHGLKTSQERCPECSLSPAMRQRELKKLIDKETTETVVIGKGATMTITQLDEQEEQLKGILSKVLTETLEARLNELGKSEAYHAHYLLTGKFPNLATDPVIADLLSDIREAVASIVFRCAYIRQDPEQFGQY